MDHSSGTQLTWRLCLWAGLGSRGIPRWLLLLSIAEVGCMRPLHSRVSHSLSSCDPCDDRASQSMPHSLALETVLAITSYILLL